MAVWRKMSEFKEKNILKLLFPNVIIISLMIHKIFFSGRCFISADKNESIEIKYVTLSLNVFIRLKSP